MIIALRCFCIYSETNFALFAFLSVFYYSDSSISASFSLIIKYKIISHFFESIGIVTQLLKSMLLFLSGDYINKLKYNTKVICT